MSLTHWPLWIRATLVVPSRVSQVRGTSLLEWSAGGSDVVGPKGQGSTPHYATTNNGSSLQYMVWTFRFQWCISGCSKTAICFACHIGELVSESPGNDSTGKTLIVYLSDCFSCHSCPFPCCGFSAVWSGQDGSLPTARWLGAGGVLWERYIQGGEHERGLS